MAIIFKPENHTYESIGEEPIDWLSVTSVIGAFKDEFNAASIADKVRKKKTSKWYGMTSDEIQKAWTAEAKRSTDLGTWYHNQREADISSHTTISLNGIELPIIKPIEKEGVKYAPDQKLLSGIYPEHFVYLKSAGLCGQSDLVEVVGDHINIVDYKTNKEIKTEGFTNWEGVTKKLSSPLNHLDDCNFNHYALQLNVYMYMMLKHNPKLKPGLMYIHHITFEEQDRDKYDNPIYKKDENGNFIVKDVIKYKIPFMRAEVITLINWLKDNRNKIKSKK